MGTVRIVHLSDLHFARGKNAKIWELVRDFVNDTVQPHAVLITGDVTDSATQAEFDFAQESLNSLRTRAGGDRQKYRIVAGNHDRYLYRGNDPPWGWGRVSRRSWPRDKAARFDQAFSGATQVTPRSPCDLLLSTPGTGDESSGTWRIRVIGLDSSSAPQWFAQGAVSAEDVSMACEAAAQATDHDLVVALVHHHILPIPAVEREKLASGRFDRLLDATGMLNAGALMEALSRSQVDLVLHGHEHAEHQARFTGSDDLASSVALLSAGSATGDATLQGWDLQRVHFNVIELDDDRSVWLRQVDGTGSQLQFRPGRKPILNAEDIRSSRFVRRNRTIFEHDRRSIRKLPTSRLRKLVEFRSNRDIHLTECRTDWQVNARWTSSTTSGSGSIGSAQVEFDWADGERRAYVAAIEQVPNVHGQYLMSLTLPNGHGARLAQRVVTRWSWTGAAAFTHEEIEMLPEPARAGPRARGHEFASVRCTDEFEELVLSVRLPVPFSPAPETVQVYYEKPDTPGVQTYAEELRSGLDFCGPGNIELRIAYPLPGYRYGISWPLVNRSMRSPHADAFEQSLTRHAAALGDWLSGQFDRRGWLSHARWAIYTPDGTPVKRLLAQSSHGRNPEQIMLKNARSLARAAFWGDAVVVRSNGDNTPLEVLDDERLVGYFAVRVRRELTHQGLGILRIAFTSDPVGDADEGVWVAEFRAAANLMALVLGSAAQQPSGPLLL